MTGRHALSVLALGFAAAATCFAQSAGPSAELIKKSAQATFREYVEMLALPNDASVPADIQKNADWLEAAFRKRGFTTRQLPNNGKPLLFAEYPRKVGGAKTVLFYMHFDGQPVIPEQWAQKVLGPRRLKSAMRRANGSRLQSTSCTVPKSIRNGACSGVHRRTTRARS